MNYAAQHRAARLAAKALLAALDDRLTPDTLAEAMRRSDMVQALLRDLDAALREDTARVRGGMV